MPLLLDSIMPLFYLFYSDFTTTKTECVSYYSISHNEVSWKYVYYDIIYGNDVSYYSISHIEVSWKCFWAVVIYYDHNVEFLLRLVWVKFIVSPGSIISAYKLYQTDTTTE